MQIKELLVNFINKKKFNKSISFLSFWDNSSIIPSNIYLGLGTRILNSKIGKYTRIKPFCVIKNANIGNYCSIANDVRIGLGKHPTGLISTNSIFYKTGIRKDWAVHIDYNENNSFEIHLKTFLDFFLIANATKIYLLRNGKMYKSGFPKSASMIYNIPFLVIDF